MKQMNIKSDENYGDDLDIDGFKVTTHTLEDGSLNLYYTGNITRTFIQDIVAVLDDYDYEKFRLILNSPGGDATPIKIAPLIFQQCGMYELLAISQCSSAALAICLETKKLKIPVYMDSLTHVVLHQSSQTELLEGRYARIDKFNENIVKAFERQFDKINKPIVSKLSPHEKDNYKNGHNVYLLGEELIEWKIFEPVNKNNFKYNKVRKEIPYLEEDNDE